VWLFDGTGSALISDPVVVLEGGTILSAGSGGRVPHCAAVIDVAGAILSPGLVDNYVHLGFDASAGPVGRLARIAPGFGACILAIDGDPIAEPRRRRRR
jgi:imidazolonepropionase-like amidohydrolase